MTTHLAGMAWPEIPAKPWVFVPVGSLEQHGPHLPLDTDTVIAEAVTRRVAELLSGPSRAPRPPQEVLVAPPVAYGASGEHQAFAGTVSIGTRALAGVLVELARSLHAWAGRLTFVNAHGGNVAALKAAVDQLVDEGHTVCWLPCGTQGGDAHAGFTETCLMLHLRPEQVRLNRAERGNTAPLAQLMPDLIASGVAAISPNGVLGDPAGASAEEGRRLLEDIAAWIQQQLERVAR